MKNLIEKQTKRVRRDCIDIAAAILTNAKNSVSPTRIMQICGLSTECTNTHVNRLLTFGLLNMQPSKPGRRLIITSDKGKQFLQTYNELKSFYAEKKK
jgi:predicted transcriptional regulator